jgi:cytochrome c551/c552
MKTFVTHSLCAGIAVLGMLTGATTFAGTVDIKLPPETARLKPSKLAGYGVAQQKCQICHSADYIGYQPPAMSLTQWTAEVAKMKRVYGAPIDDHEVRLIAVYLADTYGDAQSVSAADRALKVGQGVASAGIKPSTGAATGAPVTLAAATLAPPAPPAAPPAGTLASAKASASKAIDVQAVLGRNACIGCHAIDHKVVGPAFRDVAAKYKADPHALAKVQASIKGGGSGKWGQVAMPPFATLTQAELKALAEFVLKQ